MSEIVSNATSSPESWRPESWRRREAAQQPDWEDEKELEAVLDELRAVPPLVFAGEARNLTDALAGVYERKGFVSMRHSRRGTYIAIAVPLFEEGTDPADQWSINCSWVAEPEIDAIIDDAGHRLGEIRRLLQPALAVLSAQTALSQ